MLSPSVWHDHSRLTPLTVCLAVMLQVVLRATLDIILIHLIFCIINFFVLNIRQQYKVTCDGATADKPVFTWCYFLFSMSHFSTALETSV